MVDTVAGVLTAVTEALPGFAGLALRDGLEERTGLRVTVLNDVHAMAVAEQSLGAGRGADDVLYVAVGTGVGGALTKAGELSPGAHGWAGDIGHMVVDSSRAAAVCPCGRRGHLEALVSGPALAREYRRRCGEPGGDGDLRPVAEKARAGEAEARDVLRWGAEQLGRAIGGVVNLIDPAVVVFGGGLLALEDDLFWRYVTDALRAEVRGPVPPRVTRALFANDAAVVGAGIAAMRVHHEGAIAPGPLRPPGGPHAP
jgi:glucokinase